MFLCSKRFAPGSWREKTRDDQITVLPRSLPFWSYSLHGSVEASLRMTSSEVQEVCPFSLRVPSVDLFFVCCFCIRSVEVDLFAVVSRIRFR